jgi:hypothetical protein
MNEIRWKKVEVSYYPLLLGKVKRKVFMSNAIVELRGKALFIESPEGENISVISASIETLTMDFLEAKGLVVTYKDTHAHSTEIVKIRAEI